MPRQSRLDAPGVLHHVIIRGIERKPIFRDQTDQEDFTRRFFRLVPETETRLNPIRAGMVSDLSALRAHPFCGHGMLAGKKGQAWQDDAYVLGFFAPDLKKSARSRYLSYVAAGRAQGRRPELVGGGLIRSIGGGRRSNGCAKQGWSGSRGISGFWGDRFCRGDAQKMPGRSLNAALL